MLNCNYFASMAYFLPYLPTLLHWHTLYIDLPIVLLTVRLFMCNSVLLFLSHCFACYSNDYFMSVMNRKQGLIPDTFKVKKRRVRNEKQFGAVNNGEEGPLDLKADLHDLITFSRKLFNDALPQVVLKHQLYTMVGPKWVLMFQLGFDAEVFGLVFAGDFKAKVLGRWTLGTLEKFLEKVLTFYNNLSFNKHKMLKEFLFTGSENTTGEVVGSDWDAGSSLSPTVRFTKYLIQGRKAVLGMVKKSKYNLYHIHDIIGAELVECIPTTSGTLLRCVD
uniref:Uncharacterized protein n=1 Tax=Salmo trutta TaxID=8032 RepID=A0A674BE67_SALTR